MTHDYVSHGTSTLFAALNVLDGTRPLPSIVTFLGEHRRIDCLIFGDTMIPITARWISFAGLDALERHLQGRHATWLWAILGLAFVARAVVAAVFADLDPATANIWEYGQIARWTLEHGRMVFQIVVAHDVPGHAAGTTFAYPTAWTPPLLIFVWMGLFLLFGVTKLALAMMTALNVLTGVGIVYYSIRAARALFDSEVIALLVAIVMALHPVFVFSVTTYHALNVYILLLLILFDLTRSTRRQTYAMSVLVGVVAAVAALIRLEYLLLAGGVMLGSLITRREWKMTAVAALTTFVVIAPWTARNYAVFHRLIPVANLMGNGLFKGFNPETNGSGNWEDTNGVAARLLGREFDAVPLDSNYENAMDEIYYNAALDYMKSHPLRSFVVLPIYKVALFWIYDLPEPKTHHPLYQLQFWPLFVLSITGLGMATRAGCFARPDHRTVLILFAFQTLIMTIYAVHARYRMNVEPFLYAYAAVGAVGLWGWLHRRLRNLGAWVRGHVLR